MGMMAQKPVFQSTPPARGATQPPAAGASSLTISIHAPREGGDVQAQEEKVHGYISIHAPREGGDKKWLSIKYKAGISIHAPREGGDLRASKQKR